MHVPSKPAVLLQQGNHISDSLGIGLVGFELVAELHKIALSLALSSASRSFSLLSCYGFAGLRLHSLVVLDLSPIELDLSQLVVDNGSPVEQLLRRSLRLRQAATEPGQRGVVDRFIETAFAD